LIEDTLAVDHHRNPDRLVVKYTPLPIQEDTPFTPTSSRLLIDTLLAPISGRLLVEDTPVMPTGEYISLPGSFPEEIPVQRQTRGDSEPSPNQHLLLFEAARKKN